MGMATWLTMITSPTAATSVVLTLATCNVYLNAISYPAV